MRSGVKGFEGYLHTDAYAVYGAVHASGAVKPVYCWAHARRKFIAALEGGDERARRAVQWIGRLFLVDRYARAKGMDAEGIKALREDLSERILRGLEEYLRSIETKVLPKSALGEAMGYLRGHWDGFRTVLAHGSLSLDNNFSERQIRPVVIGRRNYFFCGSEDGARRAAILYSLAATCRLLGMDEWKYLSHVFTLLAQSPGAAPGNLTPSALKSQLACPLSHTGKGFRPWGSPRDYF
jgi:hypothetical protein